MLRKPVIAIIDANKEQFKYCKESLPKYRCLALPMPEGLGNVTAVPGHMELLLVYAGKTQQETMGICRQLRRHTHTMNIPILLVVSRYDVTHAFIIKQAGKAELILAPFSAGELLESIEQLRAEEVEAAG